MTRLASPFNLVWFRRDLRLKDNHALHRALESGLPVQPLFIFDPDILEKLEDRDDARVAFIHQTLAEMKEALQEQGGDLWVFHGRPLDIFKKLLAEEPVAAVYANGDYEPAALERDRKVAELCEQSGRTLTVLKDQVLFEKSEIQTDKGTAYGVFGAYKRKWLAALTPRHFEAYQSDGAKLAKQLRPVTAVKMPTLESLGFTAPSGVTIPPSRFPAATISSYDKTRDFPAEAGTSRLGLHLRFGTISIRSLAEFAKAKNDVYLSELIWREFFMQVLFHYPQTLSAAFHPKFDRMPWRNAPADFKRWCEGQTGVPIVDAGMRELNQTGFMHNRVRMITASYLTKHLLIDWRKGERYFARKLLDYDLAANVGNWQWVAGSGCDAAPYFRVFNPEIQAKKFDPGLKYIRRWVPEFETATYPKPIVDHAEGRDRALRAYHNLADKKA